MDSPYLIDKPLGATPLEALGMLRAAEPSLADAKLAYAGRLDPMATGLVVVLHGPFLARQEEFWVLGKEYEATFLLGVATDSHDLLGICTRAGAVTASHESILTAAAGMVGKHTLPVPLLSSAVVAGKPLFAWARQGAAPQPPLRRMVVKQWDVREVVPVDAAQLAAAAAGVTRVRGDFRQEEVLARWDQVCSAGGCWTAVRSRIVCGSGTYIRSLAHELGRRLGSGAMVMDLRRTHVGPWSVEHAVRFPVVH